MSLENILLGLLRTPASGYDLKNVFDERIHYFWSAELSQIYPTLDRMEKRGLLRSRRAPAKRGAGRRIYQTTPAGHRVLREWLECGIEFSDDRITYLAKLYVMDELKDAEKTRRYLSDLRETFARNVAALEGIERRWQAEDPDCPDSLSNEEFHVLLALRNGICMTSARVKWCDESIRRVQARMAKEASHGRTISRHSVAAHRGGKRRADTVLDSRSHKQRRPLAH
ncbi:MAG: PadR family transcriptional regulator [Candidatus Acidiferrales bacterium]